MKSSFLRVLFAFGAVSNVSLAQTHRQVPPNSEADRLSSEIWTEREAAPTLHWDLLRLPETVTRLALTPLLPVVKYAERVRLDRRIEDVVTDHDHTRLLLPVVVVFRRDGFGLGLHYWEQNFLNFAEKFEALAVAKTNDDWQTKVVVGHEIPWLDGRMLSLEVSAETDHNGRYYGIGNDTSKFDERLMFMQTFQGKVDFEVAGPDAVSFDAVMSAGIRQQDLGAGTSGGGDPLMPGEGIELPAGYHQTRHYVEYAWDFSYDTRDTEGRTSRGTYFQLGVNATHSLGGDESGYRQPGHGQPGHGQPGHGQAGHKQHSAAGYQAGIAHFIPIFPRNRVLVLAVGTAATTSWVDDEDVPIQSLVTLGRTSHLRGYSKGRFRDRTGWWGSLEYRYPIFDFRDTAAGLSSTLFFDMGRVGANYEELTQGPIRYSGGAGVRAETSFAFLFRAQVGISPEGPEITFSLNESL